MAIQACLTGYSVLTSNPSCTANDLNTMGWTLTTTDALGRVTAVQHFSGGQPRFRGARTRPLPVS